MSISTNSYYNIIDEHFQHISYQMSFDFIFPPSHRYVKTIDFLVDNLDISFLSELYRSNSSTGGRPPYNLRQMLKIMILATYNNFSYRKIVYAIKTNDNYKWFARDFKSIPSIATLSYFNSMLDKCNHKFFIAMYKLIYYLQLVDPSVLFIDGTTYKAWNNRFKSLNKKKLESNLNRELAKINDNLTEDALNEINKNIEEIKRRIGLLNDRDSCGITDNDAYILKDKRGHYMVGYNTQVISENKHGLIVGSYVGYNPSDNYDCIDAIKLTTSYTGNPKWCVADTGYGSEEFYDFLEKEDISAIIKPLESFKDDDIPEEERKINLDDFIINDNGNSVICPNNRILKRTKISNQKRKSGYIVEASVYKSSDCSNCPFSNRCLSKKNKVKEINISLNGRRFKNIAKEILISDEGSKIYNKRFNTCESIFGHIKQNTEFREFTRIGFDKVRTQNWLSIMAYNSIRIANILKVENDRN